MNDIVPDWILKRSYLWPMSGYVCAGWLLCELVDVFATSGQDGTAMYDTALSLYLVGHFPAAAWSVLLAV